jgi:hypothetical protein
MLNQIAKDTQSQRLQDLTAIVIDGEATEAAWEKAE